MKNPNKHPSRAAAGLTAALALLAAHPAQAHETAARQNKAIYVQGAIANHAARSLSVGAYLPWQQFERHWAGWHWRGGWDVYAAHWAAYRKDQGPYTDRAGTTALGITPTLRVSPAPASRWFASLGVGLVLTDRNYSSRRREMSTRYNFASHMGVGLWLDNARRHALLLRVEHVSNARIKRPNPGENFLQVRYERAF